MLRRRLCLSSLRFLWCKTSRNDLVESLNIRSVPSMVACRSGRRRLTFTPKCRKIGSRLVEVYVSKATLKLVLRASCFHVGLSYCSRLDQSAASAPQSSRVPYRLHAETIVFHGTCSVGLGLAPFTCCPNMATLFAAEKISRTVSYDLVQNSPSKQRPRES